MENSLFNDSMATLFNNGWFFLPPGKDFREDMKDIPPEAKTVSLPHAWNWNSGSYTQKPVYDEPAGTGWYFKTLDTEVKDGDVLKFGGISAECEVFINGKFVFYNLGAYKVFEVSLSGLKERGNLIAIKVTDKQSLELLPEGSDEVFAVSPRYKRWKVPLGCSINAGGIWRDVWLVKRNNTFMRTPQVQAKGERLQIQPDICGDANGFLIKCILSKDNKIVTQGEIPGTASDLVLNVEKPAEWLPLRPNLYQLETSLFDLSGTLVQTIRQPVAFFDFCIRDSEFYLNGRPYFLRGQGGFAHRYVPHDKAYIAKYISKFKAQGVEISRFPTEPPSHAWLDECDRQGIMVIFELGFHGSIGCYSFGNKEFQKTVLEEYCSVVREYRRHPSIALWCLGNELIVSFERDLGLGAPLFDVLETWVNALRPLDPRPISANSGSDAADLVHKSAGDVDDIHQYGGWYVETLRDIKKFSHFTQKNDMLFQPCISTESVAAYTDDAGEFLIKNDSDVRQRKIVAMRLGKITHLSEQAQDCQAFILKEYAEAMWRLRKPDSNFAGYLPFGQCTWFFNPFEHGPDGLKEKRIWDTYRKVLGPVHVQFECWDRNISAGAPLEGSLRLFHESISLPENANFIVRISHGGKTLFEHNVCLAYHCRFDVDLKLEPLSGNGEQVLKLEVLCDGNIVAWNDLAFKICDPAPILSRQKLLAVYDPLGKLSLNDAKNLCFVNDVLAERPDKTTLLLGPHSLDRTTSFYAEALKNWIADGGRAIILEQNPGPFSEDVFNCGIGFFKVNEPHWSRWAANQVKHADRADIVDPQHPVFAGLTEDDLRWWNGDSFLAHCYLRVKTADRNDKVFSRIGNGLGNDELMPVEYDYVEPGYSLIMMERSIGKGSVLISSMLLGEKSSIDPIAAKVLSNLLTVY